jgi:adenylate cyclase, class 2
MVLEVEQKFPVSDLAALEARLVSLGAKVGESPQEVDLYFAHPARDFAQTDEAVRVRRKGPANFLTYKGPKVDATTKTRREIEVPLQGGDDAAALCTDLLTALGFTPVTEVRKSRRKAKVSWQDRLIEASLDDVEGVGTFVELELIVDESDLEPAKACISSLAAALGLTLSERRSYLELLLARK